MGIYYLEVLYFPQNVIKKQSIYSRNSTAFDKRGHMSTNNLPVRIENNNPNLISVLNFKN